MTQSIELEMESQQQQEQNPQEGEQNHAEQRSQTQRKALIALNFFIMVVGSLASPLLLRLYFIHGGHRIWLSSWLQTGGWPIILLPLLISYHHRRRHQHHPPKPYFITPRLFLACAALGILTGLDDLLYAYGVSYLPVSTSAILISTQLGFTALFAFFIVRQRFTAFSVNAVVVLSFGALMLGMHTSGDRPKGESKGKYFLGFFMTLGAAVLYAFVLPMVELTYAKVKQKVTYTLVMEMQMVMGFFATAFCTVGMLVNNDFQAIPREAREFGLGSFTYYLVLVVSAIVWQFFFLGTIGAVHYTSALVSGVILAVLIPVTEVLAVVFFHEEFSGLKGTSLGLSLWGFASYFYGEFNAKKKPAATVAT